MVDLYEQHERDLLVEAADLVIEAQFPSLSFLQRRMGVDFGRACQLMDGLEVASIVGPPPGGTRPREVLVSWEQWKTTGRRALADMTRQEG